MRAPARGSFPALFAVMGLLVWAGLAPPPVLAQGGGSEEGGAAAPGTPADGAPRISRVAPPAFDPWQRRAVVTPQGERSALVFVPPSLGAAPEASGDSEARPPALLLVLHGKGGNGAGMAAATRFHELAGRERIVVAYPDGLAGAWNYVRGIPGYPETPDDVSFLADMAAELERVYGTDPERTYVVGLSNGGFMAQRLACDAPDRFAAFVAVAAGGFAGLDGVCAPGAPVSIAFVHGTADTNVPWGGLPVPVPGGFVELTWPLPETFAWWAERAACMPPATRTELAGNPAAGVDAGIVFTLETCAERRLVALFGLRGGGHAWPSGSGFDASIAAWSFVRDQTLR